MTTFELTTYPAGELRRFTTEVFVRLGVPEADAQIAARVLQESDLRGIDSHGVARLPQYVKWLKGGFSNPTPRIQVLRQTPSTCLVDGDGGLGIVVGPRANQMAIDKALDVGLSFVSVTNSNHFGIAGYYTVEASRQDLIGMAMSNATAQVAPAQSMQPMLGTNPISISIPTGSPRPFVLDMATSAVAYGKIEIAHRIGNKIPIGWAIDNQTGEPIQDPGKVVGSSYAMLPVGSDPDHGVHKGYGLSAVVDIISGVLSGAMWGPFCPHFTYPETTHEQSQGRGLGHAFGAIQLAALTDVDRFKKEIDRWIEVFRTATPAPGFDEVLVAGDPQWREFDRRIEHGIPLVPKVVESLAQISREIGIPL